MGANARVVLEGEKVVVVHLGAGASNIELGVDLTHRPEELESLVDEVTAEVVQQAAPLGSSGSLAPAAARLRPPALEPGLKTVHPSEPPLSQ
jgi:hypothetical protein